VTTVGEKWKNYQGNQFGVISQPYYVLADPQMNQLAEPMGYTSNVQKYIDFLQRGLKQYQPDDKAAAAKTPPDSEEKKETASAKEKAESGLNQVTSR
jgi:hypothetical protein